MKTNMAAASYHPRILSLKYGQAGNANLLTAKPQFVVCSKMTKLESHLLRINSRWIEKFEQVHNYAVALHYTYDLKSRRKSRPKIPRKQAFTRAISRSAPKNLLSV